MAAEATDAAMKNAGSNVQNNNQQTSLVPGSQIGKNMPSRRSRSRSNERSRSPERRSELPDGVSPISESQYFQRSDEFRLWLKEEKGKVGCYIPRVIYPNNNFFFLNKTCLQTVL